MNSFQIGSSKQLIKSYNFIFVTIIFVTMISKSSYNPQPIAHKQSQTFQIPTLVTSAQCELFASIFSWVWHWAKGYCFHFSNQMRNGVYSWNSIMYQRGYAECHKECVGFHKAPHDYSPNSPLLIPCIHDRFNFFGRSYSQHTLYGVQHIHINLGTIVRFTATPTQTKTSSHRDQYSIVTGNSIHVYYLSPGLIGISTMYMYVHFRRVNDIIYENRS